VIVWLDDALFATLGRDLDRLALLRNAALRRHTLIISASPDAPWGYRPRPNFDSWLDRLSERLRREVLLVRERTDRVSANAIARGAMRVLVSGRDLDETHQGCRLSLEDAVRALAQPLFILVENQINDAAFLHRIMPPLWRARFEAWERHGELRYENGGGLPVIGALVNFHCDDDNARLAFGLPAAVWRLVHFIVYDHDGKTRDCPGEQSRGLERSCDSADMGDRSHRLQRKDPEHYLPVEALRGIVERRVIDPNNRSRLLAYIDSQEAQGDARHFASLPALGKRQIFKNAFAEEAAADWADDWFERDGAWPEMTRLAERIAAAI
jgi:hypothetical protein